SCANEAASSVSRPNLHVPSASSLTRRPLLPHLTVSIAPLPRLPGPARDDRPDVGHDAPFDDVEHIMEVHGRRPIPRDHLHATPEVARWHPAEVDEALLL